MAQNLSSNVKFKIISIKSKGLLPKVILNKLEQEGIYTTARTVRRTVKKFKLKGSISKNQKSGRKKKVYVKHMQFIDKAYEENDELTANDLIKMLYKEFRIELSAATIKRARRRLGWVITGPRYCQAIRRINCEKRIEFAKTCWDRRDLFDDVIFTDESSIIIDKHSRVCFRKIDTNPRLKPKVKHPVKVIIICVSNFHCQFIRKFVFERLKLIHA